MTGTQKFSTSKRAERIRKTIAFDPLNDTFILNYINYRVEVGESFSSVVKELLLQMITLIELAPTHCHNTSLTDCHNTSLTDCHNTSLTGLPVSDTDTDKIESPFDNLLT